MLYDSGVSVELNTDGQRSVSSEMSLRVCQKEASNTDASAVRDALFSVIFEQMSQIGPYGPKNKKMVKTLFGGIWNGTKRDGFMGCLWVRGQ